MSAAQPVLIVGGGPVGMKAALLLARWGVPTVILEAKPTRELIGSKSICVQRDVLDIYHRVGVAEALMREGVTWQVGRTFYREHELFTITFPDPGRSAYPGFINIGQSSVERELESAVAKQALVDLRYAHRVTAVSQDHSRVTVRAQTPTGIVEVTGTHLVAADGSHSAVRDRLRLDFEGHSFADLFLIADIRTVLPFGAERRFHFDPEWNPGRQVLVHPQPDSVWRIDWQVPEGFDLAADQASGRLDARIRRIVGDAAHEIVWVSLYRFQQRMASRMRVGRVLLAGDAAHLMAPFGARGLNSGVQDAENAAWKIAFDRAGWAGPELLASYQHERAAAARENLRVTGDHAVSGAPERCRVGLAARRTRARGRGSGRASTGELGEAGRAVLVPGLTADDWAPARRLPDHGRPTSSAGGGRALPRRSGECPTRALRHAAPGALRHRTHRARPHNHAHCGH